MEKLLALCGAKLLSWTEKQKTREDREESKKSVRQKTIDRNIRISRKVKMKDERNENVFAGGAGGKVENDGKAAAETGEEAVTGNLRRGGKNSRKNCGESLQRRTAGRRTPSAWNCFDDMYICQFMGLHYPCGRRYYTGSFCEKSLFFSACPKADTCRYHLLCCGCCAGCIFYDIQIMGNW